MCGDYNLRREKRYVGVDVRFTPDGKIRPLAILPFPLMRRHGSAPDSWAQSRKYRPYTG